MEDGVDVMEDCFGRWLATMRVLQCCKQIRIEVRLSLCWFELREEVVAVSSGVDVEGVGISDLSGLVRNTTTLSNVVCNEAMLPGFTDNLPTGPLQN